MSDWWHIIIGVFLNDSCAASSSLEHKEAVGWVAFHFSPKAFDLRMPICCVMPYIVHVQPALLSLYRRLADCNLTSELNGVGFSCGLWFAGEWDFSLLELDMKTDLVITRFLSSVFFSFRCLCLCLQRSFSKLRSLWSFSLSKSIKTLQQRIWKTSPDKDVLLLFAAGLIRVSNYSQGLGRCPVKP